MESYNLLKGKRGIIFGALDENSIAWKVALRAKNEGAKFVLSNSPLALRKKDIFDLAKQTDAQVIAADITEISELEDLFEESMQLLGGKIDFILHSVGMSPNVRKNIPYTDLDYDYLNKTLDVSAISLHKVLAVAKKLDAISESGSVVTLSYIAAQRTFSSYSDMAHAKSVLESIVRQFGYHYGVAKKVRINSISQSPTKTTAGTGVSGFNAFFNYADSMSPLGNADADSCANTCMFLFSDLSKMITMQNIYNDGGFSSMGISNKLINQYIDCGCGDEE
ncbi:MAG: SDR family oxidoreductase [Bacteroidales bacterium]|jgi:enoyl-[acyl-carrier protein] reductase I|nr:SDR family oxidoreductase [Bacteroidales bacterium]MCK9498929.1 SDR family oxidoreductase [Bacteroidales bacterium]MDY0315435.1 SDR family oxidoreductase [Bacteroidales bacterium]NLB86508.1 SDR family oxidoreductase [Bacteroidales bacterium]